MAHENLRDGMKLCNVVHDIKSKEWIKRYLVGFYRAFGNTADDWRDYMSFAQYACDGGLVCFVPYAWMLTRRSSTFIGNPLTDEWKALPCLPPVPIEDWQMIMVQLVTEEDTKCYKVILVVGVDWKRNCAAQCYDSKTGAWSWMESGLVYGNACGQVQGNRLDDLRVFDCKTKTMYKLVNRATLDTPDTTYRFVERYCGGDQRPSLPGFEGILATRCTMVKDGLYVLHDCSSNQHDPRGYKVSEYAWQSSTSNLRIINSSTSTSAPENYPFFSEVFFFASGGFIFLLDEDNGRVRKRHRQFIRLYDSSANDWHILSDMGYDIRYGI